MSHNDWKRHYIYRLSAKKKSLNTEAYSPQLVSFGPYHNGKPDLQTLEEHKARALQQFLHRHRPNVSLPACCNALKDSLEELISSYQSLGEGWKGKDNTHKFLMLMVKDGVFLYEFMRGYPDGQGWDYDKQDPVFSARAVRNIPDIVPDILMLENQLPLTVLERLIAVEKGNLNGKHYEEVNKLVLKFLSAEPPSANMIQPVGIAEPPPADMVQPVDIAKPPSPVMLQPLATAQPASTDMPPPPCLHVLDISRKVIAKKFEQIGAVQQYKTDIVDRSAIELNDVGVKFKNSVGNRGISFENATLSLPPLTFDPTTESRFLNAIAFECLHPATNHEVSSYIAFLQGLIASPADVAFLRSKNLIQSKIGDDQAVVGLMKSISKDVLFDPSRDMCQLRGRLNKYYEDNMGKWRRRCREWWRSLHQIYLKNPWTIIAVFAAASILVLTLLQTIYTIKSAKK